jgi:hypothetical protein
VPVLEADVEVDRRDRTVAVALRAAAGERPALFGSEATLAVLDPPRFAADGMFQSWSARVPA